MLGSSDIEYAMEGKLLMKKNTSKNNAKNVVKKYIGVCSSSVQ